MSSLRTVFLLATLGASIGIMACIGGSVSLPDESAATTSVVLQQQADGSLTSCDANGVCQSLPNPNNCTKLIVEIDLSTGATCESCLDASGVELFYACGETSVACTLVSVPDPDCMVCAYLEGSVIFSSCIGQAPPEVVCGDAS